MAHFIIFQVHFRSFYLVQKSIIVEFDPAFILKTPASSADVLCASFTRME